MPLPPSWQLPPQPWRLHPKIWRACASTPVQIPTLNSRVYYFPQGHWEQAYSAPPSLSPLLLSKPFIECRVSWVEFLADSVTDEVFAKLVLHPLSDFEAKHDHFHPVGECAEVQGGDNVGSFTKVLTPSDANNGGGFSVPRFCADSIFPPLDLQSDRPNQTLAITDVHGIVWEFRHIYRGAPRRHLLTAGWNKFGNHKKLVAGDSVVFMRNSAGDMSIGVRRALRFSAGNRGGWAGSCADIDGVKTKVKEEQQEDYHTGFGEFSRNGRGKLSAKAAVDAAESALGSTKEAVHGCALSYARVARLCVEGGGCGGSAKSQMDSWNESQNGYGDRGFVQDDLVSRDVLFGICSSWSPALAGFSLAHASGVFAALVHLLIYSLLGDSFLLELRI